MMPRATIGAALAALAVSSALAQPSAAFQDWRVQRRGTAFEVFTINESNSTLGRICDQESEKCFYYLNSNTPCDDGSEYPALATSSKGAFNASLKCTVWGKAFLAVFIEHDLVYESLQADGEFTVAMPLKGGAIKVMRFSLKGYVASHNNMLQVMRATPFKARPKDSVL